MSSANEAFSLFSVKQPAFVFASVRYITPISLDQQFHIPLARFRQNSS